jgi:hypothetical protein
MSEPASGTVTLDVPAGLHVGPPAVDHPVQSAPVPSAPVPSAPDPEPAARLHYHLAAGGYAAWDLTVRVSPDAAAARYYLAARIIDEAGQLLEDAMVVAVSESQTPPPDLSLPELADHLEELGNAEAAEAELIALTGSLELRPGGRGEIVVQLSNNTASALRGEAQLISPSPSWPAVGPWSMGFAAEPGGKATLAFTVAVPRGARSGQRWWALVKVMYFGQLRYSQPVWISVIS